MKVLELGNYIAPAYAGMLLAEQGHDVEKLANANDPTFALDRGDELWRWLNAGKDVSYVKLRDVHDAINFDEYDVVLDNLSPRFWQSIERHPWSIAHAWGVSWVSLRADVGERSFDVIAQARSWMEYAPWMPLYLGDTCAGLFMAFKALSLVQSHTHQHAIIYQASALQKLVEGELIIDVARDGRTIPWDTEEYTATNDGACVTYRGERFVEPVRDRAWKLANLHHDGEGRIVI